MTIAITLVHNKTPEENEAQISALLTHVVKVGEEVSWDEPVLDENGQPVTELDGEGNPVVQTETKTATVYHYEFANLARDHRVLFFQVVPYGVDRPANYDELMQADGCGGVLYGPEDANLRPSRFANWGLKRGVDRGADLSIYLEDPASVTPLKLRNALADLRENSGLVERAWGRIITRRALLQIGQLKEDRTWSEAITEYKARLTQGGLS